MRSHSGLQNLREVKFYDSKGSLAIIFLLYLAIRKMLNHEDYIWLHRNKESWSGLHRVEGFVFASSNTRFNMFST